MSRIVRVKNNSGSNGTWVGQSIANGSYYDIPQGSLSDWATDTTVFSDVSSGNLIVNKGTDAVDDITNTIEGWNWLSGNDELPRSTLDNDKLAVHPSFKPTIEGSNTYAVWTGAGDNTADTTDIGGGDLLHFDCVPGTAKITKDIKFNWNHGRVWIHEGYLKFTNAGSGDYMCAEVCAEATPLQTVTDLHLEVTNNLIKAAAGGPGTGTHGWADATKIVLIPRLYDKDGDWDFDGVNLTANTGAGSYQISNVEQPVQRYFNKIPCFGTVNNYFTMSSDETTELQKNYFLRIEAHNVSNTTWDASIIVEIYREKTLP